MKSNRFEFVVVNSSLQMTSIRKLLMICPSLILKLVRVTQPVPVKCNSYGSCVCMHAFARLCTHVCMYVRVYARNSMYNCILTLFFYSIFFFIHTYTIYAEATINTIRRVFHLIFYTFTHTHTLNHSTTHTLTEFSIFHWGVLRLFVIMIFHFLIWRFMSQLFSYLK